ncbi:MULTISPECIES: GntR family transcriptional regulator [unclassified Roseitalea]|uniref:GntR family transcriptional regulator n=1 Tax=unclassified Roseitalea TaxID=2639107 RepID=UPI00273F48A0|nr:MULTISPECIES: GntR family transcriptional regulator [unclassified Roseitalea]
MPLKAVDITRTASSADIICEALRKAIISGEVADGEPLRQDELARLFNTSRIPVREALTRLEQQGLVTQQRYRGATVASIDIAEVSEIFDFRKLVESAVMRAAVPRMRAETLAEARAHCEDFFRSTDPMLWGDLNRQFHHTLYRDSGLGYHLQVIGNTHDRVDRFTRAQLTMTDGMERANREHQAIVEACEAGDAELAARRIADHVEGAKADLIAYLRGRDKA